MIIPMLIAFVAYAIKGIYLGGPNTILAMDMQAQYMPFFAVLRYIGRSDNSIFLNLSGALGNNYLGSVYYNLFSPMIWVTAFLPLEYLPDAIYVITILRIGLCGLGFCYYLLDSYEEKHYLGALLLSCCYALMSYNIGYSINLIWLDAVLLLPWILTGAERILKGRRPVIYIISIFASMICNYYLTFMSLIFVAFYIFVRLFELNKWSFKRALYIFYNTAISIMLSMPVVLPGILALKNGKMDEESYPLDAFFRYSFIDVLKQLFSGRYDTVYDDGLPLIFCGTGTLLLVIIFFLKNNKARTFIKILYAEVIAFYLFSMIFIPLDRIMHGFRETTCFEVRYSYAFSCLLLIIAYKGINDLLELLKKYNASKVISSIAVCFVMVELFLNSSILIAGLMVELHYNPREEYIRELQTKKELLGFINDEDFYRISDKCPYTYNDGAWLGYNGLGYFSSCYNLKVMNYLGDLGECQSYHVLKDGDRTPLEESLLGAKYRFTFGDTRDQEDEIYRRGLYAVSKNRDALSLGYMTYLDSDISSSAISKNAFDNQNKLAEELTGLDEDVFKKIMPEVYEEIELDDYAKAVKLTVEIPTDAPVWLYVTETDRDVEKEKSLKDTRENTDLLVNGEPYGGFRSDNSFHLVFLGDHSKGDCIDIEVGSTVYFEDVNIAYMDKRVYSDIIDCLNKRQLRLIEHKNGTFTGVIDAGRGGNMLLSLPYMDGWHIKVDDKEVRFSDYRGVMLIVPMPEGKHTVRIGYTSPGVYTGVAIAISAVLLMAVSYIVRIKYLSDGIHLGDKEGNLKREEKYAE